MLFRAILSLLSVPEGLVEGGGASRSKEGRNERTGDRSSFTGTRRRGTSREHHPALANPKGT